MNLFENQSFALYNLMILALVVRNSAAGENMKL